MKLSRTHTWDHGMMTCNMCGRGKDHLLIIGEESGKRRIGLYDRRTGSVVKEIGTRCDHYSSICEFPMDPNYVIEACSQCNQITMYNINDGEIKTVINVCKPSGVCTGMADSVLVINEDGCVSKFEYNKDKEKLSLKSTILTNVKRVRQICYIEQDDVLIIISEGQYIISALNLSNSSTLWQAPQEIEVIPELVCCSDDGKIYACHIDHERLLVMDCMTGELLQILLLEKGLGFVRAMCWIGTQPQLAVLYSVKLSGLNSAGYTRINCYSLPEVCNDFVKMSH